MGLPISALSEPDWPVLMVHCTIRSYKMTFEGVTLLDRAANLTGALTLLVGLVFGAAVFVLQSL